MYRLEFEEFEREARRQYDALVTLFEGKVRFYRTMSGGIGFEYFDQRNGVYLMEMPDNMVGADEQDDFTGDDE